MNIRKQRPQSSNVPKVPTSPKFPNGMTTFGAAFIDADFQSCQALRSHKVLMWDERDNF